MSLLVLYSQWARGESPSCLSLPVLLLSSEYSPKAPSPNVVLGFKLKHGDFRGTESRDDSNLGNPSGTVMLQGLFFTQGIQFNAIVCCL